MISEGPPPSRSALLDRGRFYSLTAGCLCLGLLLLPPVRMGVQAFSGRWTYILVLSFLISLCLTPLSKPLASWAGAVDQPDRRRSHRYPTPRLGGVAIFAAVILSLMANDIWEPLVARLMIASCFIFALGTAEDIFGIPARFRLLAQVIPASYLAYAGLVLKLVPQTWPLAAWINAFLTVLWLVGITNAFNFFDGMDGLASGLAMLISAFLGAIAFHSGQAHLGWVSVAVLGAALGFLPYNFKTGAPAEVFMGDSGSTVLGFILAGLAVHGEWAVGHPLLNLSPPLLIFGVLVYDMFHVTLSRISRGDVRSFRQWLETPGRDHMHHRFESLLRSKRYAVLLVLLLNFCFGLSALIIRHITLPQALILLVHCLVILVITTMLERAGNIHERRKAFP
jgi:UDP-GlcNAc:undecaprenyl-phosphate GlcNAc-1-phosphate transferase